MSGLRETKKAATRTALSRAAAQIALTDGPEALTVATVAAAAGVSARTFHNYFPSREDALFEFMNIRVQELSAQLNELPQDIDHRVAIEEMVINHLREGDDELDSFSAMFRIGEILSTLGAPSCAIDADVIITPMLQFLMDRDPNLEKFEAMVFIHLHAAAIAISLQTYYKMPEPRDVEIAVSMVKRACRLIKL
ncbi:TetR family transcriptional regulator [Corynebacterium crudilactis]|uniref:TetR family transcriptional regulator n=1 Tax=Corynebacterium crudilactis TaxID=1652495 RepID=A0A172QSA8_9CORY|nr:TetR family transcriptional regulator [Corynebacterium crudilactis]ANE03558.1 TetR family transcriptional regulator [Corynebacterium crudilactis]